MHNIEDIRKKIDEIDRELCSLFLARMSEVKKVAEIKTQSNAPVYAPDRERELLSSILSGVPEDKRGYFKSLFITLMRLSRLYQYTIMVEEGACPSVLNTKSAGMPKNTERVCYQGIEGSWSYKAAKAFFPELEAYAVGTFEQVFAEISSGRADFGVLPMENSTAGIITQVYDGLADNNCFIKSIYSQKVKNCLCAVKGVRLKDIKRAISHPHALAQCSQILNVNGIEPVPYPNTAMAAQKIAEEKSADSAAICSADAALLYGLEILVDEADNMSCNETKFIAVSKHYGGFESGSRMSITFTLPDESSGSLSFVLSLFGDASINLTSIQSRPLQGRPWEHRFYLDFDGSPKDNNVRSVLFMMEKELPSLRVLGCYDEI